MEHLFDALFYVIIVGGFQAFVLSLITLFFGLTRLVYRKFCIKRRIIFYALFNGWLLVFGLAGNLLWHVIAEGRFYVNPDPLVEYIPFVIPGGWTIHPGCGGSLTAGTTWNQMYLLWLTITIPVWIFSIFSYRWTRSRLLSATTPA